ncbi:hypothetical protein BSZ35_18180 [Salinibacter sp. 10B]|uniref:hypothetical protein n=1 Tax=Salinibacter sp. 10B TaxID=1923971 RepID=UPI000CF36B1B|nr:hypothetical protein [Salinibacter sp. 10B]PQJ26859.1 hypothetical protein BSZ35_18180 [Salinibacter sp. 10B]
MRSHNRLRQAFNRLRILAAGILVLCVCATGVGCGGAGSNDDPGPSEEEAPPPTPTDLEGNSENSLVELTWNGVNDDDLGGYNVYRDTDPIDGVSGLSPENGSPISSTSYSDEEVQNGTPYYYVVTAEDEDSNESDPSNEVEKTPFDDPPNRP